MDRTEFETMVGLDDRHWWYRGRRLIVRAELARLALPREARILDAGCGSGRMLDELARYGTPFGVDSSPWAIAAARGRRHANVRVGNLERLPYRDASFDLVTCLDVIEHVADEERALAELMRVTAPGGHVLLTVPAYQALWSAHDEANHHYRRYRRRGLRRAARAAGWEVERDTYFNSVLLPPAAFFRLARKLRRNRRGNSELAFTPAWLDGVLLAPLRLEAGVLRLGGRLPAGLSLLAVLRKPGATITAGEGLGATAGRQGHEPAVAAAA